MASILGGHLPENIGESSSESIPVEAPVWVPDAAVTECQGCLRPFSLLFRRHHCRGCGNIYCKNCSGHQGLLPASFGFLPKGLERICDKCAKLYFPFESHSVLAVDGTKIEFGKLGKGDQIIVFLHGALGNYSQGLAMSYKLLDTPEKFNKYTVIAPTRPGYGQTPALVPDNSFEKQADAIAILLDELNHFGNTKVIVFGMNTGGPVAIHFALRHSHRVACLVLISSITRSYWAGQGKGLNADDTNSERNAVLKNSLGSASIQKIALWILRKYATSFPNGIKAALRSVLSQGSLWESDVIDQHIDRIMQQPELIWIFQAICLSLNGFEGLRLDLLQAETLADIPFESISVPTLIIHGRNDGDVSFTHAHHAANRIPNCQLLALEETDHLVWLSPKADYVHTQILEFLDRYPSLSEELTEEVKLKSNQHASAYSANQFEPITERTSKSPLSSAYRNKQVKSAVKQNESLEDDLFDL